VTDDEHARFEAMLAELVSKRDQIAAAIAVEPQPIAPSPELVASVSALIGLCVVHALAMQDVLERRPPELSAVPI
jgi:hypothetical protein